MLRFPYPGLRSFRHDETDLFFGRETVIDTMVERLGATRFLAVLGASGSGKSSVVRTGLIDALEMGFLQTAGSRWRVVDFSPGSRPRRSLATALLPETAQPIEVDLLEGFLSQGPRSLVEWCRAGNLPPNTNLLVLVDQFEELFRYRDYAGREEAEGFVALLLESVRTADQPIYVTLTMRSEYLGACTLIDGLAEAINRGQFLTPRLNREQCRRAITGPAGVCGFSVAPALVNRLLNDLDAFAPWEESDTVDQIERLMRRADQLPLLQHALNRMWTLAITAGGRAQPVVLDVADYERIGGLSGTLDGQAREILDQLGAGREHLVEAVFRSLTSGQTVAEAVRRPLQFKALVAATGAAEPDVRAIVEAFAAPGRNLLQVKPAGSIGPDAVIDISHESLIRQWTLLSEWLVREAESAATWRRLRDAEALNRGGKGNLLSDLNLATVAEWWNREQPTPSWAERYGDRYEAVADFVNRSRDNEQRRVSEERDRERRIAEERLAAARRLTRRTVAIAAVLAVVAVVAAGLGWIAMDRSASAARAQAAAEEAAADAEAASQKARQALRDSQIAATIFRVNKAGELADQPGVALQIILSSLPSAEDPDWPLLPSAMVALKQALERYQWNRLPQSDNVKLVAPDVTHTGSINAARLSPDGTRLVTASDDGTARIWSLETGKTLVTLKGAAEEVNDAVFSPDGSMVLTASLGDDSRIWRTDTGESVMRLEEDDCYTALSAAWSPDGSFVVIGCSGDHAVIRSAKTGERLFDLAGHRDYVRSVAISPDGSLVATASDDRSVMLWSSATGERIRVLDGHTDWVRGVAFSPDGKLVASAADDHSIRVWSVSTGETVRTLQGRSFFYSVAFSPDGKFIAGANGDNAILWSLDSDELLREFEGHFDRILSVSFSTDGRRLVTSSDDYTARVWSVETGALEQSFGTQPGITAVAYVEDGGQLVTGSESGMVRIWSVADRAVVREFNPGNGASVRALAYEPRRKLFAVGTSDGKTALWDGDERRELEIDGIADALAFSPDGALLAAVAGSDIVIWSTETGKVTATFGDKDSFVDALDVAFTPDGKRLIVGGDDDKAHIWSVAGGEKLGDLNGHDDWVRTVAVSPDGRFIVTGSDDKTVRIWSAETGLPLRRLPIGENSARDLAFAPDGHSFALVAAYESSVSVWSADFGWHILSASTGANANTAAFSPDGGSLAVATRDGVVRIFDLAAASDPIAEARRLTADLPPLSQAQLCDFLISIAGCEFGVGGEEPEKEAPPGPGSHAGSN